MNTRILSTIAMVASCLVVSCTKHAPTAPDTESSVPEDRGTLLTKTGYGVELVWPRNTNTIFFLSGNVIMVDAQTKAMSTLFDAGGGWATSLQLSPDQSWLYFRAAQQYGHADRLYRVSTIAPSTPQLVLQPVADYCVSPDNVHLAYSGNDTLHLSDITKGTDVAVPMQSVVAPLLFSPDGKKLLCRLDTQGLGPPDYAMYSMETGQTSPLPGFTLNYGDRRLARWDDGGLKIMQVGGFSQESFTFINTTTGENRFLGQTSGDWPGSNFAWSADGTRFAYWDGKVLSYRGFGVGVVQYSLRSINLMTNHTDLIAVGNTSYDWQDGTCGMIAFSGDSRSVAYVFRCGIYLKSVP